ncbi:hypothetical protein RKE25_23255 (plasmid) [Dyella sp. BiH032]|uniref:hypothetical protein n=1 Tax=Dyella sp. BiH032 TaxID=3075430 RepID=UPI002892A013|nr:hypothetical protein [Dyella sp. BiH032]WNL48534.1 hypothetical protein RKE25_23255 [Dyella sp. BiH032]
MAPKFTHECYDDATAATLKKKHTPPPIAPGRPTAETKFVALGIVLIFAGFAVGGIFGAPWVAIAACLIGFLCFMWSRVEAWESRHRRPGVLDEIEPLDARELNRMADMAETYPELHSHITAWVKERKTLRKRDLWACAAFAANLDELKERTDAVERLRNIQA